MTAATGRPCVKAGDLVDPERKFQLLLRLCGQTDLGTVLDALNCLLTTADGVEGFLINLAEIEGNGIVCHRAQLTEAYRAMESTLVGTRLPPDRKDLLCQAIREQRPVNLAEAEAAERDREAFSTRFLDWGFAGVAAVPIVDAEGAVGAITILRTQGLWENQRLAELQELLALFAPVLRQARYYARIREWEATLRDGAGEKQRFLDFVNHVNQLSTPAEVRARFAQEFIERYPFDLVAFFGADENHLRLDDVILRSQCDPRIAGDLIDLLHRDPYPLKATSGATPIAFLQQTCFHFPDVQEVLSLPMSNRDRQGLELLRTARTGMILPVCHQGRSTGVLWLVNLTRKVELSEDDRTLIESLAIFLGSALEGAAAFERSELRKAEVETANLDLQGRVHELDRLASRDRLTGLYNFGSFEESLAREVAERQDGQRGPLSLIVFDIDHFKHFNDNFGHDAGNEVLQGVARRIQQLCRDRDIVCRYGGEEFVLILPECDELGARNLAERIRRNLDMDPVHPAATVTISAGCATLSADEDATALFKRADGALYKAKHNGRNRVEVAE